eukprot:3524738-Alexandrium_andersonii.AAC.1
MAARSSAARFASMRGNCRDGAGGVEPVAVEEEATSESECEPTAKEASAAARAAHEQWIHHLAAARAARE